VTSTIHGVKRKVAITPEFFKSLDYKEIYKLGDALDGLFEEGALSKEAKSSMWLPTLRKP